MRTQGEGRKKGFVAAVAASILVGGLCSAAMAQNGPVGRFDEGYLDGHPEVAQQLAANPALVDNRQYMASHPGLQEYFENHPRVRADIKQHPYEFMSREDQSNGWHGKYWPDNWRGNNNPYPYHGAATRFDEGYLDQHPQVAQQLSANPALADNPQFMASHPGLREYLENHPQVRADLRQHPYRFMNHTDEGNGWREPAPYAAGPHPMANTDRYLDQNPGVAQQLTQNPRLIDNPRYVQNHPGLQEFLENHPNVRQEWKAHPNRFENHVNRYERNH